MSDVGLGATLQLDIADALRQIDSLQQSITAATADIQVTLEQPDTSGVTSAIDAAVAAADTTITPEADAAEVTSAIDAAIDGVDSTVPVDADTTEAEADIAGLSDGAGATIPVDADTSEATAAIEDVAQSADTDPIVIEVQADTSEAEGAIADLGAAASDAEDPLAGLTESTESLTVAQGGAAESSAGLSNGLGALANVNTATTGSAVGLGKALERIGPGATAAVTGVTALVGITKSYFDAALEADRIQTRYTQTLGLFGDQVANINVGSLDATLDELALSLGTSDEALKDAAAGLFELGTASGAAGPEVARTTEEVLALALRTRALKPELGEAGAVADSLALALAKGGKALVPFGISITSAEIAARALADTGKQTAAELSIYERTAAGAAIATERYGDSLREVITEGAATPTAQIARIKNEFGELAETLGAPLISPVLDTLESIAPVGLNISAALGQVIQSITPALAVIGTLLDLVALIPAPLIATAIQMYAISKAIPLATSAFGSLGKAVFNLPGTFAAMNPVVAVAAIGLTALSLNSADAAKEKAQLRQATQDLTAALTDEDGAVRISTEGYIEFLRARKGVGDEEGREVLKSLGLDFESLTGFVMNGAEGLEAFKQRLAETGRDGGIYGDALVSNFERLQQSVDDVAASQIVAANASGAITDAQAEQALAADDVAGAYTALRTQIDAHDAQVKHLTETYGPLVEATVGAGDAIAALDAASPGLGLKVRHLADDIGDSELDLYRFAVTAKDAALSEEEMAVAAGVLGTDVAGLTSFIEGATGAVDAFVETTTGSLPTVGDAFKQLGEDIEGTKIDESEILSVDEFTANLEAATGAMARFQSDLARLVDEGFVELAGRIAEQGPEIGGSLAGELVTALDGGNRVIVEKANGALDLFEDQWDYNTNYLRTVLGPRFILENATIASLASESFGENLDFTTRINFQGELAKSAMDTNGKAIAAIAGLEGAAAARAYGETVLGMEPATVTAAVAAGLAMRAEAENLRTGGTEVGTAATEGWAAGLAPTENAAADAMRRAATAIDAGAPGVTTAASGAATVASNAFAALATGAQATGAQAMKDASTAVTGSTFVLKAAADATAAATGQAFGTKLTSESKTGAESARAQAAAVVGDTSTGRATAYVAGTAIGKSFALGMAAGITQNVGVVKSAAAGAVIAAENAARAEARSASPSRLFAELGMDLGLGAAVGLNESAAAVIASAEAIVRDAASAVAAGSLGIPVDIQNTGGRVAVGSGGADGFAAGDGGASFQFDMGGFTFASGTTVDDARRLAHAAVEGAMTAAEQAAKVARFQNLIRARGQR